MNLSVKDLEFIVQRGKGQTIEFKESFSSSMAKDIVAFCNSIGGKIFIGVSDSGDIKGVKITNALKSQIVDLARKCDPPINVTMQVLKDVIAIFVNEGDNKPYQCKDGFFCTTRRQFKKINS